MPPEQPPDPSDPSSDVPPSESPLPFPAFAHPMHGLYHPSIAIFAALAGEAKREREYLPNPLAWAHWDDWYQKLAAEAKQREDAERKARNPWGDEDNSRPPSRASNASDRSFRSGWGSDDSNQREKSRVRIPPPAAADLPFPLEAITGPPTTGAEGSLAPLYTLPPHLPRTTCRLRMEIQPDEQTITYGSNADYYGGSNMEQITSADLVPWHTNAQRERNKKGEGTNVRVREAWAVGRGSRRHVMVFEPIADANPMPDQKGDRKKDDDDERGSRRGSDA